MIKSYYLIGSLILGGAAAIGGAVLYNVSKVESSKPEAIKLNSTFPFFSAPSMSLASPLFGSPVRKKIKPEPIPLPMWMVQKILNPEAVKGQPLPCPLWMLYQLSQGTKSRKINRSKL